MEIRNQGLEKEHEDLDRLRMSFSHHVPSHEIESGVGFLAPPRGRPNVTCHVKIDRLLQRLNRIPFARDNQNSVIVRSSDEHPQASLGNRRQSFILL